MISGIQEGFRVLRRLGYKTTPPKLSLFRLPRELLVCVFRIFMSTQLAEITMAKHTVAAKPEMVALQSEFDELIQKSGMATPAIDLLREYLFS